MKKIRIRVTCEYDVEISKEVSDIVFTQLCDICDNHMFEITNKNRHNRKAWKWFEDNIKQSDSYKHLYEINSLEDIGTIHGKEGDSI